MLSQRMRRERRSTGAVFDVDAHASKHVRGVHGIDVGKDVVADGGQTGEDAAVEVEGDVLAEVADAGEGGIEHGGVVVVEAAVGAEEGVGYGFTRGQGGEDVWLSHCEGVIGGFRGRECWLGVCWVGDDAPSF